MNLIATTEQKGLNWLEQEYMIAGKKFNTKFEELLYKYLSECPTAEARIETNKLKDWFNIEPGFYLFKK